MKTTKDIEKIYHQMKDSQDDIYIYLNQIIESKNSYWNYRCIKLCLKEKRLTPIERQNQIIKHAQVLFDNNDLEYIIKFISEFKNKPAYQEYLKNNQELSYYKEQLKNKKNITSNNLNTSKENELKEEYYILLKEYINNPNILVLKNILETKDPYLNYKCLKHLIKSSNLPKEEKEKLIQIHTQVILNSNSKEIILKTKKILKYSFEHSNPKINNKQKDIIKY